MDGPGDARTNEDLKEVAAGGLRWMTHARIAVELAMLASMVVLARLIPPAEFGIYAVVVIVQELALTMPMEGVGGALVQRRSIEREHLQGGLLASLAVGAVLALLTLAVALIVVAPLLGSRVAAILLLALPWYLLGALYAVPVAVLRRRLDFRRLSILDVVQNLTRLGLGVGLAIAGLDAEALVLGGLGGLAAALVLCVAFVGLPRPAWRPAAMRELLPYGGPAGLSSIAWTGFRNGDYAIIAATLGSAAAGFYWRGYQLAVEYQRKISAVMTQMAFPVLARAQSFADMQALRSRMVRLLTVVIFPLLVLLVVLAPVLVPWLFGPAWKPAVVPTQILALGGAAVLVTDAAGSALMAAGRSRALLAYGTAHFGVYVGAVLVVAQYGLAAVAAAGAIVHAAFLAIAYRVLLGRGAGTLGTLWADVAPATVGSLCLAAAALPVASVVDGAPVPLHAMAVATAGGAVYLAVLRLHAPAAWADLIAAVRRVAPSRRAVMPHRSAAPVAEPLGGVPVPPPSR